MSIVQESSNVVDLFIECHKAESPEKPVNTNGSKKFSGVSYCVPKNKNDTPLNTEFPLPDVSITELKKMFTREWSSFRSMKYDRCDNGSYEYSPEIDTFPKFLKVFGPKPDPSYTLERRDPNCPLYSRDTAYWADKKTQAGNKTTTRYLTDDTGLRLSAPEWSRRSNIPRTTILQRLSYGWSEHEAVHLPKGSRRGGQRPLLDWQMNGHPVLSKLYKLRKMFVRGHVSRGVECRMVDQYLREYPECESDEYQPGFDDLAILAYGEFNRILKKEHQLLVDCLRGGIPVPQLPAFEYLTGQSE